jgi:hypothetical protein
MLGQRSYGGIRRSSHAGRYRPKNTLHQREERYVLGLPPGGAQS